MYLSGRILSAMGSSPEPGPSYKNFRLERMCLCASRKLNKNGPENSIRHSFKSRLADAGYVAVIYHGLVATWHMLGHMRRIIAVCTYVWDDECFVIPLTCNRKGTWIWIPIGVQVLPGSGRFRKPDEYDAIWIISFNKQQSVIHT